MARDDTFSPDEPLGPEGFEQGDEANDEAARVDASFTEAEQLDPSIDPAFQVDDKELEEAGVAFDDPERIVTLDGGLDDPDGLEGSGNRRPSSPDDDGWDLDAPEVPGDVDIPASED